MASWKEVIGHLAVDTESYFDRLKYRLGARLGSDNPIMIQTYPGFGSQEKVFLKGRVLEDQGITPAEDNDTIWENLVNMYKRFESDEVPFARVRIRFYGVEKEVQADEEGIFDAWIEPAQPLPADRLWHMAEIELVEPLKPGVTPAKAEARVLVPPPGARYGVISDIDDTVLQTDATHVLKMARTVFLSNARTRLPFKGVAAFYRALLRGAQRQASGNIEINPLFYVSSSPWNIFDLLTDFFHLQNIPLGPLLFLRDWGISRTELIPTGHRSHKLSSIRQIMYTYPDLPFILIGDSGQEDPEIYSEVVSLFPHRILAIYIRNVSHDLKRPDTIRELAKQVAEAESTLILADDTLPMAEHAVEMGWISAEDLPEIRAEKKADEAPPSPVEKLLDKDAEVPQAPTVKVKPGEPEQTKKQVDQGAIEEALDSGEDQEI